MKTIIISLLLFFTVNAQTIWYVDRDANGSNNGTSWTNAWKSLNNVNWTSVGSGDSIYVSGGTDSTLYKDYAGGGTGILIFPSSYGLDGRVFTQEVVIAPAWQSGHNGQVYFEPRDNNVQWLVEIHAISNIKLTGFTFIDTRTNDVGTMFYLGGAGVNDLHYRDSLITIENCYIEGRGNLIYLSGYKITIKDCYIHVIDHNYNIEQDPIGISNGLGGHSIIGNTIVSNYASETTGNHEDGIQISNIGWSGMTDYTRRTVTIANNLLIFTSPYGVSWNNLIYNYGWDYTPSVRYLIYNNIMVARKIHTALGGIAIGRLTGDHPNSLYLLNNTIILKNNGTGNPIVNWDLDTMVVKNNLVIVDTTIANFYNLATGYNRYDIDYNHYAEYDGQDNNELFTTRSSTYTWAEWKSAGYDNHSTVSTSGAVAFANKYGLNKADYYTATGRDAGVDLSAQYPFLATDILGNSRSGSWDLGALEYHEPKTFRRAMFLHRSVGGNVLGPNGSNTSVAQEMSTYNSTHGYTGNNAVTMADVDFPWNNSGNAWWEWHKVFDKQDIDDDIYQYIDSDTLDIIVIKTCYTTSGLSQGWGSPADTVNYDWKSVEVLKWHVRSILKIMENHPDKFFMMWNLVPVLNDGSFSSSVVRYDSLFSYWMKDTLATGKDPVYGAFPHNAAVFDMFGRLKNPSNNYINQTYTVSSSDNHLNAAGTELLAPLFTQELFNASIAYESIYSPSAVDSLPNTFTFTDITNAARSTLYTSNGVTLAGFDSAYAYAGGNVYTINGGSNKTGYTKVFPGNVLRLKVTSSANYSTAVSSTLTVGGRTDTYTVTTLADPSSPPPTGRVMKGSNGKTLRDSTGKIIKTR